MVNNFRGQTYVTPFYIIFQIALEGWSLVFLGNQLLYFINFKLPYKWIIIVTTYRLEIRDFWDILESLILNYSFILFSVLWKTYCNRYKHFCFFIVVLQFGELQSHSFDICIIKTIVKYFVLERVLELVQLEKNSHSANEDLVEKKEITCQKTRYFSQQN